jgi:SAM-dependent methyltransferase
MTVRVDPEQNEIGALLGFVDLDGRRVLEIGSGDGRLTWRYANRAADVTAVEPFAPAVVRAQENLPRELARRVALRRGKFSEFAAATDASTFDVTIFSWSLCCMDQSDMVRALEEARRLLRPDGTVIDIHPVPSSAEVEVHRPDKVVFAEPASASDDEGERQADAALATAVARGLFVAERCSEFDFRVYASSARELRDFLVEADAHASRQGERYERRLRVRAVRASRRDDRRRSKRGRGRVSRTRKNHPAEICRHVSRAVAAAARLSGKKRYEAYARLGQGSGAMLRGLAVAIDVPKSPRGVCVQDDHQDKRGADEPDEGGPDHRERVSEHFDNLAIAKALG